MNSVTIDELLAFLQASPTPYHATAYLLERFERAGFELLDERAPWQLQAGKAYCVSRADASLVAFRVADDLAARGVRLLGAHTDSPCLKVKPHPELDKSACRLLGVEVYGGALLAPWFDRDLSLAGRVSGLNSKGELVSALVDFKEAIAVIPSLAIHLNREVNNGRAINPQKEMNALLHLSSGTVRSFREILLTQMQREHPSLDVREVLEFNVSFYDVQAPAIVGLEREFLASARLDNLLSCFNGAQALIEASGRETAILICNDHEEVGSRSESGAQGTLLNDVLAHLLPDAAARHQCLRRSLMLSVDNAHAQHPNYADLHDTNHAPMLGAGPVIKFDANQGYATHSSGAAFVRWLARQGEVIPLQHFVMRADMRCGSTIGPITATNSGIATVDIGSPQFAMHSCRELASVADVASMQQLLLRFVEAEQIQGL